MTSFRVSFLRSMMIFSILGRKMKVKEKINNKVANIVGSKIFSINLLGLDKYLSIYAYFHSIYEFMALISYANASKKNTLASWSCISITY